MLQHSNSEEIYEILDKECVELEKRINAITHISKLFNQLDEDTEVIHDTNNFWNDIHNHEHSDVALILKALKLRRMHNLYLLNMMDCYSQEKYITQMNHFHTLYQLLEFEDSNNTTKIVQNLLSSESLIDEYDFISYFIENFHEAMTQSNDIFKKQKNELSFILNSYKYMGSSIERILEDNNISTYETKAKILLNTISHLLSDSVLDNHLDLNEEQAVIDILSANPFQSTENEVFLLTTLKDILIKYLILLKKTH